MMTGPEHYREAERLIEPGEQDVHDLELLRIDIAVAQVHATLALAAATAWAGLFERDWRGPDAKAWVDAIGVERS